MIILGIMIITALSVSIVSIKERKASMSEVKSGQAFQNAQSGVELVMVAITKGNYATVGDICGTSAYTDTTSGYKIILKKADDSEINCTTNASDLISEIASIKSIGTGSGQQRAIEAAVALNLLEWHDITSSMFQNSWGNFNNGYQVAQYAKDNNTGLVYLRGLAYKASGGGGTGGQIVAKLPSGLGLYPLNRVTFPNWGIDGSTFAYIPGRVDVDTSGNIHVVNQTNSVFANLDSIVFATN